MKPPDHDIRAFLDGWPAPTVDRAAQAELVRRLQAIPLTSMRPTVRFNVRWARLILRAQFRLVHPMTWSASGLIVALGVLVTATLYQPSISAGDLPFVLIAPLVAAVGVAFLYGVDNDPPLELQLSTPVSPHIILLARLALLYSFNLGLGLASSLALATVHAELSLTPLILAWLAPMTALSALAFLLSVLVFDPLVSVLACFALWCSQVARRAEIALPALRSLPDLLRADLYPVMFLAGAVAILLALWLADREERWSA